MSQTNLKESIKFCNKCEAESIHFKNRCKICHNEYEKKWRKLESSEEERVRFCPKCKQENLHTFRKRCCNKCIELQELNFLEKKKQKEIQKTLNKNKKYKRQDPVYYRALSYKKLYNLTIESYNLMLEQQNNSCAICDSKSPGRGGSNFHVDHCHTTGKVRGLLCTKCNMGLGYFNDDIEALKKAIKYLQKTNE